MSLGAIIGGAVGGAALLVAIIVAACCHYRRTQQRKQQERDFHSNTIDPKLRALADSSDGGKLSPRSRSRAGSRSPRNRSASKRRKTGDSDSTSNGCSRSDRASMMETLSSFKAFDDNNFVPTPLEQPLLGLPTIAVRTSELQDSSPANKSTGGVYGAPSGDTRAIPVREEGASNEKDSLFGDDDDDLFGGTTPQDLELTARPAPGGANDLPVRVAMHRESLLQPSREDLPDGWFDDDL